MSHSSTNTILSCGCTAVCICAISAAAAGCALSTAPSEGSEDTSALTTTAPSKADELFVLVGDESGDPDSRCDVRTVLSLSTKDASGRDTALRSSVLYARLHDEAVGDCKIYVDPNPREYVLVESGESCGSKIYAASWTADWRDRSLTLTDHRTRVCKDLQPSTIVVEERDESSVVRTLYSSGGRRALPSS